MPGAFSRQCGCVLQNLVLLNWCQDVVGSLRCLYCEKEFPNRTILKSHMRKKHHFKINSDNKRYDEFYLANYVVSALSLFNTDSEQEPGQDWRRLQGQKFGELHGDE